MFGHQDDITTQDHKTDVNVQLPDDAIAALTGAGTAAGQIVPTEPAEPNQPEQSAAPHRPAGPSIDGISPAPDATRPSQLPSSYLEFLGAPGGALPKRPIPEPSMPAVPVADDFAADFSEAEQTQETPPLEHNPDLQDIKRAALEELSPLIGQLDQTPEERFKTLMMLIQASDNQALLADAHDAARQISDEKLRAEALLEVVNEVNYFTRQRPA